MHTIIYMCERERQRDREKWEKDYALRNIKQHHHYKIYI